MDEERVTEPAAERDEHDALGAVGRLPVWPVWLLSVAFLGLACTHLENVVQLARVYYRAWKNR